NAINERGWLGGRLATEGEGSPLSTTYWLLTRHRFMIARRSAVPAAGTSGRAGRFHPIWYAMRAATPYLAVNEVERPPSRRFGRDSFQTRSTCQAQGFPAPPCDRETLPLSRHLSRRLSRARNVDFVFA